MKDPNHAVTDLLGRWQSGDRSVEQELMTIVYPVLRVICAAHVRRSSGVMTMQATELANEAYEKLAGQVGLAWSDRDHFYAHAATVIRRLVVDYMRSKGSIKRGGGLPLLSLQDLTEDQIPALDETVDWLSVDEALRALADLDGDCARVVELKFFSGLATEKIAEVCGSSVATIGRQWRFSRAFLSKHLDDQDATG